MLIAFGINGDDEALAAESFGRLINDVRCFHGGGVDTDFVRAGQQHLPHVCHGADATTYGQRHEAASCRAGHDIDHGFPLLMGGGDVQEDELISTLSVVNLSALHRITRIPQFQELRAFDDTPFLDVETGDDAFGEHGEDYAAAGLCASQCSASGSVSSTMA